MRSVNAAMFIGLVLALFGAAATYFTFQIPLTSEGGRGAQVFPAIGSLSILVLGLFETVRGLRGDNAPFALSDQPFSILGLLLLSVIYLWGITHFGYLIATGVVAPLAMWLFGIRNPLGLLSAAIICPTLYHLIFFKLLGVFPPYGLWFDLLDVIAGA